MKDGMETLLRGVFAPSEDKAPKPRYVTVRVTDTHQPYRTMEYRYEVPIGQFEALKGHIVEDCKTKTETMLQKLCDLTKG